MAAKDFIVNNGLQTTGNVVLNTPISGITLTVNGIAGSNTAVFQGSSSSGNSYGLAINAGTTTADFALNVANQANSTTYFSINGNGGIRTNATTLTNFGAGTINTTGLYVNNVAVGTNSLTSTYVGYGNSSNVLTGSSGLTYSTAGNLVVAAPSSGAALSVNGAGQFTSAITSASSGVGAEIGYSNTFGFNAFVQGYNRATSAYVPMQIIGSTLSFNVGGSSAVSINASGNMLINAPTSGTTLTTTCNNTGFTATSGSMVINNTNSSGQTNLDFQIAGSLTGRVRGDYAGNINYISTYNGGHIFSVVGQTGLGTTAVTIPYNGGMVIATPASGNALTVNGFAGSNTAIIQGSTSSGNSYGLTVQGGTTSADFALSVNNATGTNFLTVKGSGNVTIAAPSSGAALTVNAVTGNYALQAVGGNASAASISNTQNSTQSLNVINYGSSSGTACYLVSWLTDSTATARGYVFFNGSSGLINYTTSSDERLKKNIADSHSASSIIDSIKVRQFDWKETGNHLDHWFVAQELHKVVPHAVTPGDHEKPWHVDVSTLVPLLVKEIQELRARVAALESKGK